MWTFKTKNGQPILITPDKKEVRENENCIFYPGINYENCGEDVHIEGIGLCKRITVQEYNKLTGIRPPEFHLVGRGFTGKDITMENRQKKALEKNPMHTTMKDYQTSNPDSVVTKARKKNYKYLKNKGIQIKSNQT